MPEVSVRRRPRVLHVACNLGSGVAAAIAAYASSTPELDHALLAAVDPTCPVSELTAVMAQVRVLPAGRLAVLRAIRAVVAEWSPDIVHAHSSYAGAYTRLALGDAERIVHTPHCYGFDRRDLAAAARGLLWLAEAVLSFRGRVVAACSPREYAAARAMPARRLVVHVPNVAPAPVGRPRAVRRPGRARPLVVSSGRLCAQKAPQLFASAARAAAGRGARLDWCWVGDGEPTYRAGLEAAGVQVTGWLPREHARVVVENAQVYVHTAAWESAPLTILEAAGAGVPVLARDQPALRALGLDPLWADVDELVADLATYPSGPPFARARESGRALAAAHTPAAQRAALLTAYGYVLHRTRSRTDAAPITLPAARAPRTRPRQAVR